MKLDSFWSFDFQSLISFNYLAIRNQTNSFEKHFLDFDWKYRSFQKALRKPTPFRKIRQIKFCELMGKLTH